MSSEQKFWEKDRAEKLLAVRYFPAELNYKRLFLAGTQTTARKLFLNMFPTIRYFKAMSHCEQQVIRTELVGSAGIASVFQAASFNLSQDS
jgi:hypothetical protein